MKKLFVIISIILITTGFSWLNLDETLKNLVGKEHFVKRLKPVQPNEAKVELGRMLFFDKILSGNKDISCATCHHPGTNSGDNLPLAIGVGGTGLGEERSMGENRERIPRNSPEIFNRGMEEWHSMFWDSRVSGSVQSGFETPVDEKLPEGFDNLLAVQAMFPVTSRDEMRGEIGDMDENGEMNELALISPAMPQSIWHGLMTRLKSIPGYRDMFQNAYPGVSINDIDFVYAANAIAAFEIEAFSFYESPWDLYVTGDEKAMTEDQKSGALLFFGKANCASCHSGTLFSDQKHHNLAVPQFGPGKERYGELDLGRYAETGDPKDRFAFRTPPLRNVSLTGPWMHNGAFNTLEDVIKHHLDPENSLRSYEIEKIPEELRSSYKEEDAILNDLLDNLDPELDLQVKLKPKEIDQIVAFLQALTDPKAKNLDHLVPELVPSGLEVDNFSTNTKARSY